MDSTLFTNENRDKWMDRQTVTI